MRLTPSKIEEVLGLVVGQEALVLVRELLGKSNVSEFDLAIKLKLDIKVIRRLLYSLYNHNVISFTRKKDKQKGWYIYYWTLEPESIRFSYFKFKRDMLARLEAKLAEEQEDVFFISPDGSVRLNFDEATKFDFHCPETGQLLQQDDNTKRVELIKRQIISTSKELEQLQKERDKRRSLVKIKKKEVVAKKKKTVRKKAAKKKVTKKKVVAKKTSRPSTKKKTTTTKKKTVKKKVAKKKAPKKAPQKSKKKVAKKSPKKKIVKKKTNKKKSKK